MAELPRRKLFAVAVAILRGPAPFGVMKTHFFASASRVILCVAMAAQLTFSDARADGFGPVRERIQDAMAEQNIPSVAVAVSRGGRVLWEEGFGWANIEQQVPATAHSIYALASVSKPMTATALMVLVERDRIGLDRPINDYLGRSKVVARVGNARDATVRRVANHTSGLPVHYQFFYEDESARRPSMAESIRRYGQLLTMPGETYTYSNLGYGLLEYAIEQVTGTAYDEFMLQEVFKPLGMHESAVNRRPDFADRVAMRYGQNGKPVPFYDFDHRGASAVYASAHDVLRFAMFHLKDRLPEQRRILSDAAVDAMQKSSAHTSNGRGVGVAWHMRDAYGTTVVGHGGDMAGVSTRLALLPMHGIAIVVLANRSYVDLRPIESQIVQALLPEAPREQHDIQLDPSLNGKWRGGIETHAGRVAVDFQILAADRVKARIGPGSESLVSDVTVEGGALHLGNVPGSIGTDDAGRYPYRLDFDLRLRGNVLNGTASAISRPLPGRDGNALSYWVELHRVPAPPAASHQEN